MATSSNWNSSIEELTLCPICFEKFKCPKTLPCLHNFCESCIGSYLTSLFEKEHDNVKCVNCPICRADAKKPGNVNTSEEWTKCLPTNHMLASMVDAVSGFQDAKNCNSCYSESKTESAVFWCVDCREAICEACERKHSYFIKGHKVIHLEQMTEIEPKSFSISIKCTKHEEKALEAYCFDHQVPCCSSCVMITHRKCNRVEEAKTAAEELRNSKLIIDLQEHFENHKKRMDEMSNKTAENVKSFKDKVTDIQNEISSLRSDINRHLDDIELKAKQELTALEKEHVPEMEATVEIMSGETKRADNDSMILKASVQYASDEQFLCDIEKLIKEKKKINEIMEEKRANAKRKQLIFEMNDDLENIRNVHSFMKVFLVEEKITFESDQIDLLQTEMIKVSQFDIDNNCTRITGCTMVGENRLLLATNMRNRIEMYGIDGARLSFLDLGSNVWSIAVFDKYNGVATLRTARKIVFFSMTDKDLSFMNSVDCSSYANLYGIQIFKDRIYVGSKEKIIIMEKDGSVIKDIAQSSRGCIGYFSISDGKLVYINANEVYCITLDGDDVFHFSDPELRTPEGISVDSSYNIYVIGQLSRNIFQLNPEGKLHRVLLENLSMGNANSLFFCKHSNRLIFNTGNTVHVYEMMKRQS